MQDFYGNSIGSLPVTGSEWSDCNDLCTEYTLRSSLDAIAATIAEIVATIGCNNDETLYGCTV